MAAGARREFSEKRFVFGQRFADRRIAILETLVDAARSPPGPPKAGLLARVNRDLEVLRWLLRMAEARRLLTARQCRSARESLEECGRMLGGWLRQASGRSTASARSSASSPP